MAVPQSSRARGHLVLLVVLILGVAAASAGLAAAIAPQYSAKAEMVFIAAPLSPGTNRPTNPFLNFGDSLNTTASVIAIAASNTQTALTIERSGGSANYTIGSDNSTNNPILLITATASTQDQAKRTVTLVTDQITAQLAQRQTDAGAPANSFISAYGLSTPDKATRVWKKTVELVLAVFVLGLIGSLSLVYWLDRRRRDAFSRQTSNLDQTPANSTAHGEDDLVGAGRQGPAEYRR